MVGKLACWLQCHLFFFAERKKIWVLYDDRQQAIWPLVSLPHHSCVVFCHSESGQVCTTHRIWQKWLNITWRLCQKYHSHFCFASSWITHSGEKPAAILWGWIFKQPTKREFHLVPCRQPAPSSQLSECTILVAGCPAPGKPSDDLKPQPTSGCKFMRENDTPSYTICSQILDPQRLWDNRFVLLKL